ncbi:hypothetical protein AeMF1_005860 [Aphanomyces euteiches]|nr:hypothetical protein AeMF1_005860 [Aphanomyces euteiches]KAH9185455.1 hypothetical protein AeNC1_012566 [Aphanomyces euteiches]
MVWWYGPCAAWGCCASLSWKENATTVYELSYLISKREGRDGHQVYLATHRDTGDVVALKVLPRSFLEDKEQRRHMRREIHVLSKLNHPNLVRLFDVYESANTVEIAFELAQGGQVYRRVLEPHASVFSLSEAELSRAFADIVQGLCYLHARGWIHGDVRLEHILYSEIDPNSKALLVDFGRAGPPTIFPQALPLPAQEHRYLPTFVLNASSSMVPNPVVAESLFPSFKHAIQVDMYALGVCLYAMLFAQFPSHSSDGSLIFSDDFTHISRAAKDLLSRLLSHDEAMWIHSEEAAAHPWLRQPSVAPPWRWNPYILALHEQFVLDQDDNNQRTSETNDKRMSNTMTTPEDENKPRSSWISTDGVLVLENNMMHSADGYIHQADMELEDTPSLPPSRASLDIPLTQQDIEAAQSERGWRLMWKGLGFYQDPVHTIDSPTESL